MTKASLTENDIDSNITININKLSNQVKKDDSQVQTEGAITPDILNDLIKQKKFVEKIRDSLYALYEQKEKKYTKFKDKAEDMVKKDQKEKEKLKDYIKDQQKLDNMFPMINVNIQLAIKCTELIKLAKQKKDEFLPSADKPNKVQESLSNIFNNLHKAINDPDKGIISVSGDNRVNIRNQLCKILFILSKGYKPFMDSFMNVVFTGPAGVGKTTLAMTMGYVYQMSGILLVGDVIVVSPKDMIGPYIGSTAAQASGVLMKGLENVLFIDEAYQIMNCRDGKIVESSASYGPEAITEIVNFLDKYIGLSIMIVAGYEREMKGCFFAANEGLNRRFPVRYQLPKYDINSLLNIFLSTVSKRLDQNIFFNCKDNPDKQCGAVNYIYTIMVLLNKQDPKIFENQAGDMVNLASIFINVYYGSYGLTWPKDGPSMVNMAFSQFLKNKQYDININVKS